MRFNLVLPSIIASMKIVLYFAQAISPALEERMATVELEARSQMTRKMYPEAQKIRLLDEYLLTFPIQKLRPKKPSTSRLIKLP